MRLHPSLTRGNSTELHLLSSLWLIMDFKEVALFLEMKNAECEVTKCPSAASGKWSLMPSDVRRLSVPKILIFDSVLGLSGISLFPRESFPRASVKSPALPTQACNLKGQLEHYSSGRAVIIGGQILGLQGQRALAPNTCSAAS